MTLKGWTLPLSPTGKASLLPPPPWHYSGEVITADFIVDPAKLSPLLPTGMSPNQEGLCSFVFADWCSSADLDPRIKDDPSSGQYHEAYLVVHGTYEGKPMGRVPFIWVDSDLSLVRGLIQGFPKKMGIIAMTRPVEIGKGGYKREAGALFSAHLSSHGRRLATLTVRIERNGEDELPKGVATPLLHTRLWPSLDKDVPAVWELTRAKVADFEIANLLIGSPQLTFEDSEFEELAELEPVEMRSGYVCSVAFSVTGAVVLPVERSQNEDKAVSSPEGKASFEVDRNRGSSDE